jgi:ElaB/YqjD/DUF883 family membrane-anchored ribosome-binding protein
MEDQVDNNPTSGYGDGTGTAARMKEEIASKAANAKGKITDFGRKAAEQIDGQRDVVADRVHQAADGLEATADYLREHDLKAMVTDVQKLAKKYPGQSLAVAAVVGFLIGRLFRSAD